MRTENNIFSRINIYIKIFIFGSSRILFAFIKLFMILLTDGGKVKERLLSATIMAESSAYSGGATTSLY
jgi:hypothetical protein